MRDRLEKSLELLDVEHRLRDRVLRARVHLPLESPQLVRGIDRRRIHADADRERASAAPIALPPGSSPWFKRLTRFVRPIESMSKTAVASGYGPIFGGSPVMIEQVAQSHGGRAEQIAQHAEQIAVAAAVVRDRLDADALLDEQTRHERTHAALRARPVGHVHRIDARDLERGDALEHSRRVDAARRHDLHGRDELVRARSSPPSASARANGTGVDAARRSQLSAPRSSAPGVCGI